MKDYKVGDEVECLGMPIGILLEPIDTGETVAEVVVQTNALGEITGGEVTISDKIAPNPDAERLLRERAIIKMNKHSGEN